MEPLRKDFPDVVFIPVLRPEVHPQQKLLYQGSKFSSTTFPKGHTLLPGRKPLEADTIIDRNVSFQIRDGTTLYTDIYRPLTTIIQKERVPAILVWSPYGKIGDPGLFDLMGPYRCGVPLEQTSGYEKFEGPDPADWCARGYAVVNVDPRGVGDSEGEIMFWGQQEAEDIYDTIDFLSKQAWCNGSVVMAGNSWLAVSQVNHASRCPHPNLKAIAPWEAFTDVYRQAMFRGGVTQHGEFWEFMVRSFAGTNMTEHPFATYETRPLFDDYWASKVIASENISIPIYGTASFSTTFHSEGSFYTFLKAKSEKNWLRVHPYQEWSDLYRPEMNDDLQLFFDRYSKNIANGWEESTPRVRISLLGFEDSLVQTVTERPASAFPLPGTENRKYFLDASTKSLSPANMPPQEQSQISYEGHHLTDCVDFTVHFDQYTELAGYPFVKLWMSCTEHTDMDVHVQIRKINRQGKLLMHMNYECPVPEAEVPSTDVVKYLGPNGVLRASHRVSREQETGSSDDCYPSYKHDKTAELKPGEIVPLYIPIWPMGMVFAAGEGICLRVSGHSLRLPATEMAITINSEEARDENIGRHVIHTGGCYDSFLVVPVAPSVASSEED
ncbi:hypothetical protein AbraIFM66951_006797 [Aspergillus brasiliensis]|uniref:Xaa-Pro dipeptidyl-peptidase C-terminal domain-containing protein n=1 Tax=Aspergillus brasiliensis TaxID=319629 RepID=A0A9W5YFN6_9EURO|nr:hypothetical protein AbraCBS73388_007162 [Aspergillus brasiliensis]GKZ44565.1 hypothetical protein AbraIFM66951_006797 [Aspergillus brasiliensis]